MYKFVLLVTMGQNQIAMLTNEPDLLTALEQFEKARHTDDKNSMLPSITGAKLISVTGGYNV